MIRINIDLHPSHTQMKYILYKILYTYKYILYVLLNKISSYSFLI